MSKENSVLSATKHSCLYKHRKIAICKCFIYHFDPLISRYNGLFEK